MCYFEYSHPDVRLLDNLLVEVSFRPENEGKYAGAEVVQMYVRGVKSAEERPQKELKGFEKLSLEPGESKMVRMVLDKEAFYYFNTRKNRWVFEKGEFDILLGPASDRLILKQRITLKR